MISKDKTYRTRDGREVRIYATDGARNRQVHGAINSDGNWYASVWSSEGKWSSELWDDERDLIEVKPRIRRTVWLHFYADGYMTWTPKPAEIETGQDHRIACVKVEIDCEEGEGL